MNLLLEGTVIDRRDTEIAGLRDQIERLEEQLAMERRETERAKREAGRAVSALRRQLDPLYKALQMVFGEIESIGPDIPEGAQGPAPSQSRASSPVWETWKRKLGGKQADFISALQEHGEMTAIQLKIATHSGTSTVSDILKKLQILGLVSKSGSGRYSLREM